MLKALNIPVEEFLKPLFDAGETVCIRVFADRKGTAFKGLKLEYPAGKIASAVDNLKRHNEQNRGIFFVVNYGGHEDSDITRINAQFVENDSLSIEEQLARIEAFPLSPSMIVRTKKSLHAYWLIKAGDVTKFRSIQKRLIAQFDGDSTCINESRVLRLPGFEHRKGDPFMVECIKFNPELRYTQEELEAVLPIVMDATPVSASNAPTGTRKGLILVCRRCEFIQHCKNNAATLSEHDWYAMITNLAVFEGGDKVIHQLSKSYPAYNPKETQDKINHYLESGTKPITCKTIAEKGFRCPKLLDGSSFTRSPFSLVHLFKIDDGLDMAEKEIVAAILSYLKTVPYCFAWKEHGGMYGTAGIPDIICCIKGRFVAFEVKTDSGRLTKLQEAMIRKIKDAKGKAYKVTSIKEVKQILDGLED